MSRSLHRPPACPHRALLAAGRPPANAARCDLDPPALLRHFEDFVVARDHPCVMARSVVNRGGLSTGFYGRLGTREAAAPVWRDMVAFGPRAQAQQAAGGYASFAAFFDGAEPIVDERAFEGLLWRQLQAMHDLDVHEHRWDPAVSADPASADFSFSLGGRAYFVIGLHPMASRQARRFPVPALVFNPHSQFEALRERGQFLRVRDRIRERDAGLQGAPNPMLSDHGSGSEAVQYAGRSVGESWRCPFQPRARPCELASPRAFTAP